MKTKNTLTLISLVLLTCAVSINVFAENAPLEFVEMPDEALAAAVRKALELAPDAPITRQALQRLVSLDASSSRPLLIKDLTGLEHATRLRTLDIPFHEIHDLRPLSGLTQLETLDLGGNQISDVTPLKDLTLLWNLDLYRNQISDVTPLKDLTLLRNLDLGRNQISDVTPLKDLILLKYLRLGSNLIINVSPLSGLTQLENLSLGNNQISDVTPLKNLTLLWRLSLSENQISDVTPLKDLTLLRNLFLGNNQISDVTPLKDLILLKYLWLGSNQISDVTPLAGLTLLEDLSLGNNQISDVTPLAGLTLLEDLSLYRNQISDVTPLAGLTLLETLSLSENQISDVTPLKNLTLLEDLSLGHNQISDVTPFAGLTQLEDLALGNNQISDVTPLKNLTLLWRLSLYANQIRDVTPIQHLIDSKNVRVLLYGNPIGEPPEGADLVIESITAEKKILTPGESFTLTATLKNQGAERADAPIYYRWHRATHPNFHSMTDDERESSGATEEISDERYTVVSETVISGFGHTREELLPMLPNQPISQDIDITAEEPGTYYYYVCVESSPDESDPNNNCSDDVKITVATPIPLPLGESLNGAIETEGDVDYFMVEVPSRGELTLYTLSGNLDLDTSLETTDGTPISGENSYSAIIQTNFDVIAGTYYVKVTAANNSAGSYIISAMFTPNRPVVRLIHFIPSDETYNPDKHAELIKMMEKVQAFYGCATRHMTYGRSFEFDLLSYVVNSNQPKQHWIDRRGEVSNGDWFEEVWAEIKNFWSESNWGVFDERTDIYLAIMEADYTGAGGEAWALPPFGRTLIYNMNWLTIAHELGHTFGLGHNFGRAQYMMSYCNHTWKKAPFACDTTPDVNPLEDFHGILSTDLCDDYDFDNRVISQETADWLAVHRAFNPPQVANDDPAVMEIVTPTNHVYSIGTNDFSLVVRYTDNDKTHQIQLYVPVTEAEEFASEKSMKLHQADTLSGSDTGDITYNNFNDVMADQDILQINIRTIDKYGNITSTWHTLIKAERADIDKDGDVDQEDVAIVTEILNRREPVADYADVNGDENVDVHDLNLVKDAMEANEAPGAPIQVSSLPIETVLLSNYPNPLNPETWIPYQLAEPADVSLTIYDIQGRVVRDLDLGHQRAGMYHSRSRAAYWDGRNAVGEPVASGLYFYTLTAGDFSATRKMLIRK